MTDNKDLIQDLKSLTWGGPGKHVDSWEEHDAVINRAIAALSAQPAPVAADPFGWHVSSPTGYFEFWKECPFAEGYEGDLTIVPLYTSPPPQSGPEPIPRPIDFFNPLTLDEAKARKVCRICQVNDKAYPGNPFVYHFGTEHAHRKCIDAFSPAQPHRLPRR